MKNKEPLAVLHGAHIEQNGKGQSWTSPATAQQNWMRCLLHMTKKISMWKWWNVMFSNSHLVFVEWQEIRRIWRRWPACGGHWASDATCCLPRDTSTILHSLLVRILPWRKGKLETKISATHMFNAATSCKLIGSFLEILPVPCGTLSLHTKHHHGAPVIHQQAHQP